MLITLLSLSACGRTNVVAPDGGNLADGRPADTSRSDRGSLPPKGCAALAAFASGKLISTNYARKVQFSPSLRKLALVTHVDNAPGKLHLLTLPAAASRLLAPRVSEVHWLPDESGLVARVPLVAGKSTPYSLVRYGTSGGPGKPLGQQLCNHLVTPDGRRAYVVSSCDKENVGKLTVVDLKSITSTTLATDVAAYSLAVSADSRWAAYVRGVSIPSGCYNTTGTAVVVDASGTKRTVTKDVLYGSLQFTRDGRLLARRLFCTKPQRTTFVVADAGTGALSLQVNETQSDFYGYGFMGQRYTVSPDGKEVLYAPHTPGLNTATLAARSLTSGVTRVLAKDLFPFHMTSMAYHAWALGNRGRHVAYVRVGAYPAMGLATLPLAGGKARVLAPRLYGAAYVAAGDGPQVAWIETNQAGDVMELNLGSVTGTQRVQVLVSPKQPLSSLSLLPTGRGVMVVQRVGAVNKLHLGAATGGTRVLGQWQSGYLTSSYPSSGPPVAGYRVDPLGCAVVYNQDLPGVARGAYLRQIFSTP